MSWEYYNPNPVGLTGVGDCAVRAVAKALGITWEQAYVKLSLNGYLMGDVSCSDLVWGAVLREAGFHRRMVPNECPDCYTVEEFCSEHPEGTYVIKSYNHVATATAAVVIADPIAAMTTACPGPEGADAVPDVTIWAGTRAAGAA